MCIRNAQLVQAVGFPQNSILDVSVGRCYDALSTSVYLYFVVKAGESEDWLR